MFYVIMIKEGRKKVCPFLLVATGLEKVSFHSNPKERQCQRIFKILHIGTH